jgi:GrpB-like predicted nucleotidyltransferase (UPF0157 family)
MPSDPVEIVPSDEGWADRFRTFESMIRDALGVVAVRVEHIGSTSVPGLAAKPVIDIQVSVVDLDALDSYKPALEALGWPHRPHPEDPDRHVVEAGGVEERKHLLHRDFLRARSDVAAQYGELKVGLARELGNDRQAYQLAKSPFIAQLEADAERWAAETGWKP